MTNDNSILNYDATGNHNFIDSKRIKYSFGKYEIVVELSSNNEFVGIGEIKLNRDFLENEKLIIPKNYHDVDEFYTE